MFEPDPEPASGVGACGMPPMSFELCVQAGLLAIESSEVIQLRIWRLYGGGARAFDESILMVCEKLEAGREMTRSLVRGSSLLSVVERYRGHVAANAHRLKAETARPLNDAGRPGPSADR